jgi:hypothetical protein
MAKKCKRGYPPPKVRQDVGVAFGSGLQYRNSRGLRVYNVRLLLSRVLSAN